ncbi:DUF6234 family protein [Streptomyces sp. NPDC057280]|uniref:DUF6234 family protein n=1 Tax=Streptomyces sp. NPDC057280 TaxID=3346081 RepID=UPI003625BA69
MAFEPSPRLPGSPRRGDGFAGGCISLIVLLTEVPVAILLVLMLSLRGWGDDEQVGAPQMDWVPVLWLGGFTVGVLAVAVAFLRFAHPYAAAVQLVIAAVALLFTMTVWRHESERAHPPPLPTCPTRAGTPCTPPAPADR